MRPDEAPTDYLKKAADELARTWDTKPKVFRHLDEPEENSVFIASATNCPWEGVTAIATLGLSEQTLGFSNDLRVEIVGACATGVDLSDVLSTCAFNAIKDAWPIHPGAIHNDVVRTYNLSATLEHLMFVAPFLWEDGPHTLHLDGRVITWLMAVPISHSEMNFADQNGYEALNKLFEQCQIDIFDINRPPVV